ncbi:MAG: S-layer homology domain-containing protein [Kineosporiaceae bacterium]|nr:S-layer homology domain-containing protein [Aeromicrobium sp.]
MASFLFKLSGEPFTAPSTASFADVDSSSAFDTAIEWLASKGISVGTAQSSGKPLFRPTDAVSRQAMALFLARYSNINVSAAPTQQGFADVPIDAPAASAIAWIKSSGISTGTVQSSGLPFHKPVDAVSRQAMAVFLYRLSHPT